MVSPHTRKRLPRAWGGSRMHPLNHQKHPKKNPTDVFVTASILKFSNSSAPSLKKHTRQIRIHAFLGLEILAQDQQDAGKKMTTH